MDTEEKGRKNELPQPDNVMSAEALHERRLDKIIAKANRQFIFPLAQTLEATVKFIEATKVSKAVKAAKNS